LQDLVNLEKGYSKGTLEIQHLKVGGNQPPSGKGNGEGLRGSNRQKWKPIRGKVGAIVRKRELRTSRKLRT